MNQFIFLIVASVLFCFLPLWFLFSTIREFKTSREIGRELDLISSKISDFLLDLHVIDIASFDAEFSNWLEATIPNLQSKIGKSTLRLLIQAKYMGLGEGHREKLSKDDNYRKRTLEYTSRLAESYKIGEAKAIYKNIGALFEQFMCMDIDHTKPRRNTRQHVSITTKALEDAAENIGKDFVLAKNGLSDALREVVALESKETNIGMSLLLLQWALIKISQPKKIKKKLFVLKTKTLPYQFQNAALHYKNEDLEGTIYAIIASS